MVKKSFINLLKIIVDKHNYLGYYLQVDSVQIFNFQITTMVIIIIIINLGRPLLGLNNILYRVHTEH